MADESSVNGILEDDLAPVKPDGLRDWFAGMAVSGILANSDPNMQNMHQSGDDFADLAYEVADAMMLKREGKSRTFGLWPIEDEERVEVST